MLSRIADAAGVSAGQPVVEIGPGRGALTKHLLARGAHVTAVEIDPECVAALAKLDAGPGRLSVFENDVLHTDLGSLAPQVGVITGNLPYYITSPILRRVYSAAGAFTRAVFLIQKEVAERLCAQPGTRDYSYLTVLTLLHADPSYLFTVPPGAFRPPPRVESAVVELSLRQQEPPDPAFVRFAAQSFREPRKTLRNNLKALYAKELLADATPELVRAEALSVSELREIWLKLSSGS